MTSTIVKMQFGSHVYGTNLPTSDLDFKAVHIPLSTDILLQRVKPAISVNTKQDKTQKNSAEDIDLESFALQKYMAMLMEGQTVALSMLFTPEHWIIGKTSTWEFIHENRQKWLHRGVTAFAGYCRQQANKYGIKGSRVAASRLVVALFERLIADNGLQTKLVDVWPEIEAFVREGNEHVSIVVETQFDDRPPATMLEVCNRKVQQHASLKMGLSIYKKLFDEYGARALQAESNQGVDWKAMMHAVRVCREAEELLLTQHITYPRPEAALLLQVRQGQLPYKDVAEMLERGLERLEECQRLSSLPDKADAIEAEKFVLAEYARAISRAA